MRLKELRYGATFAALFMAAGLIAGIAGCGEEAPVDSAEPVTEDTVLVTEATDEVPEGIIDLKNTICPVMDLEVMDGQFVDWEGFRVHFCCAGCDQTFLAAPEDFLPVLAEDAAVAARLSGAVEAGHTSDGTECPACGEVECVCEGVHEECAACGEVECVCEGMHEACAECGEVECVCEEITESSPDCH